MFNYLCYRFVKNRLNWNKKERNQSAAINSIYNSKFIKLDKLKNNFFVPSLMCCWGINRIPRGLTKSVLSGEFGDKAGPGEDIGSLTDCTESASSPPSEGQLSSEFNSFSLEAFWKWQENFYF